MTDKEKFEEQYPDLGEEIVKAIGTDGLNFLNKHIHQKEIEAKIAENEYWIKQTMRSKSIEFGYKDFEYRIAELQKEKEG